jgi:hypothetical protein
MDVLSFRNLEYVVDTMIYMILGALCVVLMYYEVLNFGSQVKEWVFV